MLPSRVRNNIRIVALVVCVSFAGIVFVPVVCSYLRPVYPAAAEHRGRAFRGIWQYIKTYSEDVSLSHHNNEVLSRWSWRFMLARVNCHLPIEAKNIDWSKSWVSARGKTLEFCGASVFSREDGSTFVVAVTGSGTAYDIGFENLAIFPRDLILFVETRDGNRYWMEPKDCDLQEFDRGVNVASSEFGGGFHVAFADGSVWYLHSNTPPLLLRKFLTRDTAAQTDREVVLRPFAIVTRDP